MRKGAVFFLAAAVAAGLMCSAPAALAATSTDDVLVVWNSEQRVMDMITGGWPGSCYFSSGANGQLEVWRPEKLREDAAGDGDAHIRSYVKANLAEKRYVYVEMQETAPVEMSMSVSINGSMCTFVNHRILEAGRVYKFDLLASYQTKENPDRQLPDKENTYEIFVDGHFAGAFDDNSRLKIKYVYFGDETLERLDPAQANEAVKLDFAGATMDPTTQLNIRDDLSMEVSSDSTGTYAFSSVYYINFAQTPYVYIDIEGCYPGDVWFLDLSSTVSDKNKRVFGFVMQTDERQVFRADISQYKADLDITGDEGEIRVNVLRTDEDEISPITINGIYFGDDYFAYEDIDAVTLDTPVDEKVTPASAEQGNGNWLIWVIIGAGVVVAAALVVVFILVGKKRIKRLAEAGTSSSE